MVERVEVVKIHKVGSWGLWSLRMEGEGKKDCWSSDGADPLIRVGYCASSGGDGVKGRGYQH